MKQLLLPIFLLISNSIFSQIPSNGLVAYFPFNGNAKDSSAYKTHGTTHNVKLVKDRFGNNNSAYLFSGNTNSYIEFPSTNLKNNTYTYSLWAKINHIPDSGMYSFALNIGSTGGDQNINTSNKAYNLYNGWIGGGYNTTSPNYHVNEYQAHDTNNWHHIICVRNTNHALLYIDGQLIDSSGTSQVKIPSYGTGTVKAFIGLRNNFTLPFDGIIDDVCIYNRALNKSEVQKLHSSQLTSIKVVFSNKNMRIQKINLYPNPNNSLFNIDLSELQLESKEIRIKIVNQLGQNVFDNTFSRENNLEINSQLTDGQYIVYILDSEEKIISVKKIIVNR
jgi:trimeric autotransporter adhesin